MEIKLSGKSDAQRIADRLKPSAGPMPDTATTQTTTGTGPTRVVHTIHSGRLKSNMALPIMAALTFQEDDDEQTRHRWRKQQARISQAFAQAQEAKAHLRVQRIKSGNHVHSAKTSRCRPRIQPHEVRQRGCSEQQKRSGTRAEQYTVAEPRYVRPSQSRQLCTSPRHSQLSLDRTNAKAER